MVGAAWSGERLLASIIAVLLAASAVSIAAENAVAAIGAGVVALLAGRLAWTGTCTNVGPCTTGAQTPHMRHEGNDDE